MDFACHLIWKKEEDEKVPFLTNLIKEAHFQ